MQNTVEQDSLCYCGSGKEYTECHLIIEDKIYNKKIENKSNLLKKYNIKSCMHPNKNECDKKIAQAHSIQNNKVLNRISDMGDVTMVIFAKSGIRVMFDKVGRRKATTFTGFCKHHDQVLFKPIEKENYEYKGTMEEKFLFAYRAFAYEFHKSIESGKYDEDISQQDQLSNKQGMVHFFSQKLQLNKAIAIRTKEKLDISILSKNYDSIETMEFVYEGEVSFAVSSAFNLKYDLKGTEILETEAYKEAGTLFMLTIIPCEGKTVILMSWLESDKNMYYKFKEQVNSLNKYEVFTMLNNMIASYCENVVFNPTFINEWSKEEKRVYLEVFKKTIFFSPETKQYMLKPTIYNLFKDLV